MSRNEIERLALLFGHIVQFPDSLELVPLRFVVPGANLVGPPMKTIAAISDDPFEPHRIPKRNELMKEPIVPYEPWGYDYDKCQPRRHHRHKPPFSAPAQVMACPEGKKWQDGEHDRFSQARKTPEQPVGNPFPDPIGVLKVENKRDEETQQQNGKRSRPKSFHEKVNRIRKSRPGPTGP